MKPRQLLGVVVLGFVLVLVLARLAQAAPHRGCQQCLDSGTNPLICYLTYGPGCL